MHAAFRVGETTLMASDGRCKGRPTFEAFALSLTLPDETSAERLGSVGILPAHAPRVGARERM
jgi:uncharacterized glyoxalase superfamily protein PhnB